MYLLTSGERVIAVGDGCQLNQYKPTMYNRQLFIDIDASTVTINTGPLSGFTVERHADGAISLLKNGYYLRTAPNWTVVEHFDIEIGDWQKFKLIDYTELDELCKKNTLVANSLPVLEPAGKVWGGDRFIECNPSVVSVEDCFYLPHSVSDAWGVFGSDGDPLYDAMTGRHVYMPNIETELSIDDVRDKYNGTLIYCGFFNCHFGHFLIDTLPRMWWIKQREKGVRLLFHSSDAPAKWFERSFVVDIFKTLELNLDDVVIFDRPTRIKRLIVPRTSLVPQRSVHRAYGEFGRHIGSLLIDQSETDVDERPIYYSKTKLEIGVFHIHNENELEDELSKLGVNIIHPQQLSFKSQIALMNRSKKIIATTGSFLHTSIFCNNKSITALANEGNLISNFLLIDKAAQNNATYYVASGMQLKEPTDYGFIRTGYLSNPKEVARALYEFAS